MAESAVEDIDSQDNNSLIQNESKDDEESDQHGLLHSSEMLKKSKHSESEVTKQSKGNETAEQSKREDFELSNRACILYYGIMGLFGILVILRLLPFLVFTTYDTKCMIIKNASVIDCHQDGILPYPEFWINSWIIFSFISSILFLIILYIAKKLELVKIQSEKPFGAWRNGSFISFFVLFLLTLLSDAFQIGMTERFSRLSWPTSLSLLVWPIVIFLVIWCLNYTPQAQWRREDCPAPSGRPGNCPLANGAAASCPPRHFPTKSCRQRAAEITLFFFYWISLLIFFLETICKLFAVTIDVAYIVVPVIETEFADESLKGASVLLLGFRLAFHIKLVCFFWEKMFHGDKDLFSEPCLKLEDNQTRATITTSTQTEEVIPPTPEKPGKSLTPEDLERTSTPTSPNSEKSPLTPEKPDKSPTPEEPEKTPTPTSTNSEESLLTPENLDKSPTPEEPVKTSTPTSTDSEKSPFTPENPDQLPTPKEPEKSPTPTPTSTNSKKSPSAPENPDNKSPTPRSRHQKPRLPASKKRRMEIAPAPTLLRGGLFGFFATQGKKKRRREQAG